jgi:hypothetical protein
LSQNYEEILKGVKYNVRDGKYRFTIHALERRIERNISRAEIEDAILSGEIIEKYPQDKYIPSCLILGYTKAKRPLHIQVTCNPVWIITCYDPSEKPDEWSSDFKHRRMIK